MESFIELSRLRRSHRAFEDKAVSEDDVKTILKTALMSPSAKGLRKWQFLVTEDKAKIVELSLIRKNGSRFLESAPVVIAVLGEPAEQDMWIEDGSIAAVTMQYAAQDLGLGSCWCQIRGRNCVKEDSTAEIMTKEILGIPEQYSVLCLLGLGYSTDDRKAQNEDVLKWENVHFESFE